MKVMKTFVMTKFYLLLMRSSLSAQNNEFDSLYIEYNGDDQFIRFFPATQTYVCKAPNRSLSHLFKKVQVLDTLRLDQLAAIELRTSE